MHILQNKEQKKVTFAFNKVSDRAKDQGVQEKSSVSTTSNRIVEHLTDNLNSPLVIKMAGTESSVQIERTRRSEEPTKREKDPDSGAEEVDLEEQMAVQCGERTRINSRIFSQEVFARGSESSWGISSDHQAPEDPIHDIHEAVSGDIQDVEHHVFSLDPNIEITYVGFRLYWIHTEQPISRGSLHGWPTKNQASGLDIMEALHATERPMVAAKIKEISGENRSDLLSLRRTAQDLQWGNVVLKAVPSFHLVLQVRHGQHRHELEMNGGEQKIRELVKPTHIRVPSDILSFETLDAYDLPWEWDEASVQVPSIQ